MRVWSSAAAARRRRPGPRPAGTRRPVAARSTARPRTHRTPVAVLGQQPPPSRGRGHRAADDDAAHRQQRRRVQRHHRCRRRAKITAAAGTPIASAQRPSSPVSGRLGDPPGAGHGRDAQHEYDERERTGDRPEREPDQRADDRELDHRAQSRGDQSPLVPQSRQLRPGDRDRDQQRQHERREAEPGVVPDAAHSWMMARETLRRATVHESGVSISVRCAATAPGQGQGARTVSGSRTRRRRAARTRPARPCRPRPHAARPGGSSRKIVFGSSANSIRRIRLYPARCSRR